jgi:hypothetical protein
VNTGARSAGSATLPDQDEHGELRANCAKVGDLLPIFSKSQALRHLEQAFARGAGHAAVGLIAALRYDLAHPQLLARSRTWRTRPGVGRIRSIQAARREDLMRFDRFMFGCIRIDGTTYEHDVVIEGGRIRKRKKRPSKAFRSSFGHTPLSIAEDIPWACRRLVVGTGANGAMPVMEDIKREAQARHVELIVFPTAKAIEELAKGSKDMNAILHVTC